MDKQLSIMQFKVDQWIVWSTFSAVDSPSTRETRTDKRMHIQTHMMSSHTFICTHTHTHSASHLAATLGSILSLQLLQAYGASFSVKSVHGATPLHEAAANGHTGL